MPMSEEDADALRRALCTSVITKVVVAFSVKELVDNVFAQIENGWTPHIAVSVSKKMSSYQVPGSTTMRTSHSYCFAQWMMYDPERPEGSASGYWFVMRETSSALWSVVADAKRDGWKCLGEVQTVRSTDLYPIAGSYRYREIPTVQFAQAFIKKK